ncbi:MAG: prolipoprotein diacylglyceryl transferase [Candidatus Thermofonsia Clade 1 bacterium]|uniref:Prolipoprotein diacylglyceryl transferase n=1 Tax=Candidatus Thermofonsia Clade 1 bacterium TaxID=2364210 RepID=A0A2M8Q035_9CHLR|nr:MAG: prolipoprotein diacylglyceryl transferase [Candidatus Thermofonsia Clade 1 bacterium]PJF43153.1 MAG: prolipoprotein diacylglyceryl transferase [Candidatus Thermofonsia Clade 1 bacterium]
MIGQPFYGAIVVLAVWLGMEVAARLAKRRGLPAEHVWRAMLWMAPCALLGARLWFILLPPESVVALGRTTQWLLTNFFDLNQGGVAIWTGGLGIFGAVIGGGAAMWFYARRHKQPLGAWLEIAVIALAVGQTVGRLANGLNGEHYGVPTDLPFGVLIAERARVGLYSDLARFPPETTRFHPVWLYEMLLTGALAFGLWRTWRAKTAHNGDLALWYLLFYCGGRFFLEGLKVNVPRIGAANAMQIVCALCAAAAALRLLRR